MSSHGNGYFDCAPVIDYDLHLESRSYLVFIGLSANLIGTRSNLFKSLRKPKSQEFIAIVSGLLRSGTSMMMKILESGGLPLLTDNLRIAGEDNPKGYFEFERVMNMPDGDISWVEDAQGKAVKVISALLEHLPAAYTYRFVHAA